MESNDRTSLKSKCCVLCGTNEDDVILYGKFHQHRTLSAHMNCLLFSSGLEQRGSRADIGISRFLFHDIKKEVVRGKRLRCPYCKKIGATIGCVKGKCPRSFHFPCGVKSRSMHQYFGCFNSYCYTHRPTQEKLETNDDQYCYICCSQIPQEGLIDCLYSPCCKNSWFHRQCLQRYALSAGRHFFKCPLCNNSTKFVEEMQQFGIHIPHKDADWEIEGHSFEDLLYRPECDSSICQCLQGENHDGKGAWRLLACAHCGGRATHRHCRRLGGKDKIWVCNECKDIEERIKKNREAFSKDLRNIKLNVASLTDSFPNIEMGANNVVSVFDFMIGKPELKVVLKKLDDKL